MSYTSANELHWEWSVWKFGNLVGYTGFQITQRDFSCFGLKGTGKETVFLLTQRQQNLFSAPLNIMRLTEEAISQATGWQEVLLLPAQPPWLFLLQSRTYHWGWQRPMGMELLGRVEGCEEAPHSSKRHTVLAHLPSLCPVWLQSGAWSAGRACQ